MKQTYHRKNMAEIKEFFQSEFNSVEILYLSIKNFSEVYIAAKDTSGRIFGVVCQMRIRTGKVLYKVEDEEQHPYYYNAPAKLLKMLSPTDNVGALAWRAACTRRATVKKGMRFNHPTLGVMIVHKVGCDNVIAIQDSTNDWRVLRVSKDIVLDNAIKSATTSRSRLTSSLKSI
jgi:hypothetical protein